jgi:PKD repeat protein
MGAIGIVVPWARQAVLREHEGTRMARSRGRLHKSGGRGVITVLLAAVTASALVWLVPASPSALAASAAGPTAAITAAPSTGSAPLLVNFNGSQSYGVDGTIATWDVSFGDGTPDSSGVGPPTSTIIHKYANAGMFSASLTVTNRSALHATATATVAVGPHGGVTGGLNGAIIIPVTGAPVTDVTSSPVALSPSFVPTDTDYVWYCVNGTNNLTLTLHSSGVINAGGQSGTTVGLRLSVANNQAVVLDIGGTSYWIRCLPATFPHLQAKGTSTSAVGYYLTGTFKNSPHGIPGYPIILNRFGTPVWYLTGIPFSGDNVELLPGTHTIAWSNQGPYSLYNLDTQSVSWIAPPTPPPDEHELYTDSGGNRWMISIPVQTGYNLAPIGYPNNHNVVGCVVQEVDPHGHLIWTWDASKHVSPLETNKLAYLTTDQGLPAVDPYHCNSVDVDPLNPNLILVSMREVGVILIDKATGSIVWKFGGTAVAPLDQEPVLAITGDPEGAIQGQHDARFQPNSDISLFDDHTGLVGAARAIQYTIDSAAHTAAMSWQFAAPSGVRTSRMGSVRRYDANGLTYDQVGAAYLGPTESLTDWGQGVPSAGFTMIDGSGIATLDLQLPKPYVGNRGEYVPASALDLTQLRNTSGTPFP